MKREAATRAKAKRPVRTKRSAAARRAAPEASALADITLRTPTLAIRLGQGDAAKIDLRRAAMEWTYIVRNRRRWAETADAAAQQAAEAGRLLRSFGVDDASLRTIARTGAVEVDIPWTEEARGWEARIFPWEYVIGAATRGERAGTPLTVMRRLDTRAQAPKRGVGNVLFVASEPGPLQGRYDFASERELVRRHFGIEDENRWAALASPTRDELHDAIVAFRPDVIHLAGFDTHLAARELAEDAPEAIARMEMALADSGNGELQDGYVLAGPRGALDPVDPELLAAIITAGGHRPRLVAFSIPNSAPRLAPLAVAHGAHAAIGFQDLFDDDLAELFFAVFYSTWCRSGWDLATAFRTAWETVRHPPAPRTGTGVVLWSAASLVPQASARAPAAPAAKPDGDALPLVDPDQVSAAEVARWLAVKVQPFGDLNYSLLHNGRPLFEHFSLVRKRAGVLRAVQVRVTLCAGSEVATFTRTLDVDLPLVDLRREVHVPLTSALARSVHESVRTSLLVEIAWGRHVVLQNTYKVRLVPVDQWRDTDADRLWLPSFVFPRDPAVTGIVATASRYVRVLRDDPTAGFDGYQSYDPRHPETAAQVDLQVQAIWSAIVHELRLAYINPPPGYSKGLDSQRLRTPSMVARDRSGTCIDLALFLAACLELVDIYPVVFLLKNHAFPGYWRAAQFHTEFRQARPEGIQEIAGADARSSGAPNAQGEPWFLGPSAYREIAQRVKRGHLVPLEAVKLTEPSGFADAMAFGDANLENPRAFDAMIDIVLAREAQVTPLPIWGEQA